MKISLALAGILCASLSAQQKNNPKVDQAKVDAAIKKGVEWLKAGRGGGRAQELGLLAMVHGGVKRTDPDFSAAFEAMLAGEPSQTYRVALQAMVLEEVDRVKYQLRLHQCAQFLVDNQCENGQWSYGQPTNYTKEAPTGDVATPRGHEAGKVVIFGDPEPGQKPPVRQRIPVKQNREGPRSGDNSNSQYAMLGLRACHDAGIILPREVILKAEKWWRESQEGNVNGVPPRGAPLPTGTVPAAEPLGWSYGGKSNGYGSMTAGAVGALVICDHILGYDWKRDPNVHAGLAWLRENFSVTDNPKRGKQWHYYYLYGLERAGMLYGTDHLGRHDWYAEGAAYLLGAQNAGGSWGDVNDTCFAILFLRRATRPLVESRDSGKGK